MGVFLEELRPSGDLQGGLGQEGVSLTGCEYTVKGGENAQPSKL